MHSDMVQHDIVNALSEAQEDVWKASQDQSAAHGCHSIRNAAALQDALISVLGTLYDDTQHSTITCTAVYLNRH